MISFIQRGPLGALAGSQCKGSIFVLFSLWLRNRRRGKGVPLAATEEPKGTTPHAHANRLKAKCKAHISTGTKGKNTQPIKKQQATAGFSQIPAKELHTVIPNVKSPKNQT